MITEDRLIRFLNALGIHRRRLTGRHERVEEEDNRSAHHICQISTLNAIMEGAYDGTLTVGQLRTYGDFGLGTFNALDGEMIVVDGQVYQARVDGTVRRADDQTQTPFAVVQFFTPEWQDDVGAPLDFAALPQRLSEHLPSNNYFYALRIDGHLEKVRARSVARQQKPYRPLVEVIEQQRIFDFEDIRGTILGFRFPDYTQGLNMPGWHLHFISEDRQHGGHVLDFTLSRGRIAIAHTTDFHMELPEHAQFARADLDKDQSEAIEKVER